MSDHKSGGLFKPLAGFGVTFRQMFRKKVTTEYPKDKRAKPQRFHGRHVLNRYPDGMEKCIGCELCAGVCPASCIYVRGEDNPVDAPVSPGERYGFVYEINMLRCIFCAMCVEACPCDAIRMVCHDSDVMGDHDDGDVLFVSQGRKQLIEILLGHRVDAGGRLIQDQQSRL